MRKFIFLIIIMVSSFRLYSQQIDTTYCDIPLYTIKEKSFFDIIDTMLYLEKQRGIEISPDSCSIIVSKFSGLGDFFHFMRDTGNFYNNAVILSSVKDSLIIIMYNKYIIRIPHQPYYGSTIHGLLEKTDKTLKLRCVSEEPKIEDDTIGMEEDGDFWLPFIRIISYYEDGKFHIRMKMDENGKLY